MKTKKILLPLLAVAMVLSISVGSALAYFTTYAGATGGYSIELGTKTDLVEDYDSASMTKILVVTNDADSQPVFVRAKAFSGSQYNLTYSGSGWSEGADGYYYYDGVLEAGASSAALKVAIDISAIEEDAEVDDTFNVVVIYESTPAHYKEDGTAYADWNVVLDSGEDAGGVS